MYSVSDLLKETSGSKKKGTNNNEEPSGLLIPIRPHPSLFFLFRFS